VRGEEGEGDAGELSANAGRKVRSSAHARDEKQGMEIVRDCGESTSCKEEKREILRIARREKSKGRWD
jgi:hypothetical protein